MLYQETMKISPQEKETVDNMISGITPLKEGESFERSCYFPDGKKVTVKCLPSKRNDGKALCRASLSMSVGNFPLYSTDRRDSFVGEWNIEYANDEYSLTVTTA